jgi:hypothetical protein
MKYRYETHMHTAEGSRCARATAEEQVRFYIDRGFVGVGVPAHFLGGEHHRPAPARLAQKDRNVLPQL